jgi:hypothetical protein
MRETFPIARCLDTTFYAVLVPFLCYDFSRLLITLCLWNDANMRKHFAIYVWQLVQLAVHLFKKKT